MDIIDRHFKELENNYYDKQESKAPTVDRTPYEISRLNYIIEMTTKRETELDFYDDPIKPDSYLYELEFTERDYVAELEETNYYNGTAILLQDNLGYFLEEHDDISSWVYIGRGAEYLKKLED